MRNSILVACLVAFSAVFASHIIAEAQSRKILADAQAGDLQARPFTDLTFEIATPNQSLLPLQPIPLTLKLGNQTAQSILGHLAVDFSGPVHLYVKKTARRIRLTSAN